MIIVGQYKKELNVARSLWLGCVVRSSVHTFGPYPDRRSSSELEPWASAADTNEQQTGFPPRSPQQNMIFIRNCMPRLEIATYSLTNWPTWSEWFSYSNITYRAFCFVARSGALERVTKAYLTSLIQLSLWQFSGVASRLTFSGRLLTIDRHRDRSAPTILRVLYLWSSWRQLARNINLFTYLQTRRIRPQLRTLRLHQTWTVNR